MGLKAGVPCRSARQWPASLVKRPLLFAGHQPLSALMQMQRPSGRLVAIKKRWLMPLRQRNRFELGACQTPPRLG